MEIGEAIEILTPIAKAHEIDLFWAIEHLNVAEFEEDQERAISRLSKIGKWPPIIDSIGQID